MNPSFASALGGALRGGLETYQTERDAREKRREFDVTSGLKEEQLAAMREIAEMRAEVQRTIADLVDGRHDRPSGNAQLAAETAAAAEDGRNSRWSTPSGNAKMTFDTAAAAEAGRNSRWATPSGNATLGAETTRRGQNMTFDLGKLRNATTERGQDIGAGVATRGQDAATDRANAAQTNMNWRAKNFGRPGTSLNFGGASTPSSDLPRAASPEPAPAAKPPFQLPTPRSSSAAPAAAAPTYRVGQVVNTRSGRVRITKVNPDGTFEADPVR
jgi:hypothetical protein